MHFSEGSYEHVAKQFFESLEVDAFYVSADMLLCCPKTWRLTLSV